MKNITFIKTIWNKYPLSVILTISFLVRIVYLSFDYSLWWDSHVYLSMGKYFFSGGEIGFWEQFRPPLYPLLLGLFWKIGFNFVLAGKIIDIILSLIAIILVYKISERYFPAQAAGMAALLFGLTPFFIVFTGILLADPLALVLGLIGIWFLMYNHKGLYLFLGGMFLGLSFLTRFPQGIWFAAASFVLLFSLASWKEKGKQLLSLTGGFFIIIVPYLIINSIVYHNPFLPFASGTWIVTTATWLYGSGLFFYFIEFSFKNPIYLFFFVYVYFFITRKLWKEQIHQLIFSIALVTFLYFLTVPRKEVRYLATALPFLAMGVGYTLYQIYNHLKQSPKPIVTPQFFIVLCILFVIIPLPVFLNVEQGPDFANDIERVVYTQSRSGIIISSSPEYTSFLEEKAVTLNGLEYAPTIYEQNKNNRKAVIINDCDFPCAPEDTACQEKRQQFISSLREENKEIFKKEYVFRNQICLFQIFIQKMLTPQIRAPQDGS